jgi:hypothetical protein
MCSVSTYCLSWYRAIWAHARAQVSCDTGTSTNWLNWCGHLRMTDTFINTHIINYIHAQRTISFRTLLHSPEQQTCLRVSSWHATYNKVHNYHAFTLFRTCPTLQRSKAALQVVSCHQHLGSLWLRLHLHDLHSHWGPQTCCNTAADKRQTHCTRSLPPLIKATNTGSSWGFAVILLHYTHEVIMWERPLIVQG